MAIVKQIKDLVFQEPQDKNESPKIVVVLRMSTMIFMLYLITVSVGFVLARRAELLMGSAVFLILYGYVCFCSYQDKVRQGYVLLNITTILWVSVFYLAFGGATGVQHFFFALIVVDLLIDRGHPIRTLLILYAFRMALYIVTQFYEPAYACMLPSALQTYMFVVSMVLEGAMILFTGIYFTKDAFQMENRLLEYNTELKQIASTDPLTKLWNRFRMLEHVNHCLRKYKRGEMQFMSVAIGDIDHFKHVNDTYGHECGDEVLRQMAQLFQTEMQKSGAVARWGGEEFLFLFENMNGDDAWTELSRLQIKLNHLKIPYEDQIIQATMTFGLTEYDPNMTMDDNIKLADDKLYKGKDSGRNRIVY